MLLDSASHLQFGGYGWIVCCKHLPDKRSEMKFMLLATNEDVKSTVSAYHKCGPEVRPVTLELIKLKDTSHSMWPQLKLAAPLPWSCCMST
jgi:hypothetical protein